jgi:ABC-type branched-subunit amino acid transport system ATPase component
VSLLSVEGVTAGYEQMEILHDVSIEVRPGEIVTLIGPNGAGKSTLMKTVFGLLTPRRGSIRLEGQDITGSRAPRQPGTSYVPQVRCLPVAHRQENARWAWWSATTFAPARAGPRPLPNLVPSGASRWLSGRAPDGGDGPCPDARPCLLLLDEPSAGSAPILVDTVFEKIEALNRNGLAILLVEQSAREALRRSHRGYVLAGGQVRLEGPGPALLEDAEVARLYLGG